MLARRKKNTVAKLCFCVDGPLSNEIPKGLINRKMGWRFSCCTSVAIVCGNMSREPKRQREKEIENILCVELWGFKLLHHNVLFAHSSSLIYRIRKWKILLGIITPVNTIYESGCGNLLFTGCLICWQNLTSCFHTFITAVLLLPTLPRDLLAKNQCEVKQGALRDYWQALGRVWQKNGTAWDDAFVLQRTGAVNVSLVGTSLGACRATFCWCKSHIWLLIKGRVRRWRDGGRKQSSGELSHRSCTSPSG